jgi:hypothetical protein
MANTRKLHYKDINSDAAAYVGEVGSIFFDPATTTLRIGDGYTQGGIPVTDGKSAGVFSTAHGSDNAYILSSYHYTGDACYQWTFQWQSNSKGEIFCYNPQSFNPSGVTTAWTLTSYVNGVATVSRGTKTWTNGDSYGTDLTAALTNSGDYARMVFVDLSAHSAFEVTWTAESSTAGGIGVRVLYGDFTVRSNG